MAVAGLCKKKWGRFYFFVGYADQGDEINEKEFARKIEPSPFYPFFGELAGDLPAVDMGAAGKIDAAVQEIAAVGRRHR
jgi:hypothetical protein